MTEDQIERAVEQRTDTADSAFMAGKIGQEEYDARMHAIRIWADIELRFKDTGEGSNDSGL